MALKSDRYELQTDISFFYNAGVAERGVVVCHGATVGSGAAMDQGVNLATKSTTGEPLGVLLNDVVNKDLTRTHLNQHKDEVQKGGKVTILRKGYVVTDAVTGTPTVGDKAYRCTVTGGNFSTVASGTLVGSFLSTLDEDGYAKVEVNLPN